MSVQNQSSLPPEGTKDLPHFVSDAPFDLRSVEKLTPEQERIYFASQLTLMWWKFKRHRVAVWSGIFLLLLYGSVLVSEFLSPWNYQTRHSKHIYVPPQSIHLFHEGEFIGPFVYDLKRKLNLETMQREYSVNEKKPVKLSFFCSGEKFSFISMFIRGVSAHAEIRAVYLQIKTGIDDCTILGRHRIRQRL